MSFPTKTQQSQFGKTHETFCIRFCEQVEKHRNQNATASSPQYTNNINKIFTQMADETRWKKFGVFLKKKSELDGGDLLARFTSSWFNSLQKIAQDSELHRLRMFLFVFDLMNGDTLKGKSLIALNTTLISQLQKFETKELIVVCDAISDRFIRGGVISKRWTGIASDVMKRVNEMDSSSFAVNEKSLNGCKYLDEFLLKLLDDVLVTGSFNSLASLISSCSLQPTLCEYTENLLNEELNAQPASKLIALLVWIPSELCNKVLGHLISHLSESEDLFALSNQLNEVFVSNAGIARLAFNLLKKDRHWVTSRMFALICQLLLCNIPRLHQSALIELKQSIGKLWKHCDKINDSAWMRSVIGECDIELLKNNFDKLLTIISTDQQWFNIVEQSLRDVAFMLIDDKSKWQLKIAHGRIEGNGGVLMIGKRLLLTIAATKPDEVAKLLDKIFQKLSVSTNHNSSLVLIDTIVTIVVERTIHLLNSWKSLRPMVDAVCCFSEENGVLLVRALLPVIVQRDQLVQLIVSRMRRYVLCETTSSTALSILLLLLRSSTIRSAIRNDQFTQSFATFSTQALQTMGINPTKGNTDVAIEIVSILKRALSQPASTRSQLYKGIIEASYANENLVDGALDLLLTHLSTALPISRDNYVESNKASTVLLEPLPQLIQAVSVLVRLSIHSLRNTSTQVVSSKDAQVVAAISELDKFIEFARDRDVHDLEVDKLSDFSTSVTGRANLLFSTMLIALYDVLIEHLWHVGNVLLQKESAEKITSLLRRRDELSEVMKEKMAKKKETKLGNKSISMTLYELNPQLQTLSSMILRFIEKPKANDDAEEEVNGDCLMLLREGLFGWSVRWAAKISDNLEECAQHSSLLSLTAFAKANLMLYIGDKDQSDEAMELDIWDHKKTDALTAFSSCLSMIASKYGAQSQSAIIQFWQCVNAESTSSSRQITLNGAAMRLLKHLLMDRLAKLLDLRKDFDERKMASDHTKQSLCLLMAAKSLIKLVPISIEKFQNATFKFIVTLIQKHEIHEKSILREVWTLLIAVARHGNCDSKYTNFLERAALYIVATIGGDDPMDESEVYQSITDTNVIIHAEMLISACSLSLCDIRLATDIIAEPAIHADVNGGLIISLDLCRRLSGLIELLLPIHIVYAILKEPICSLLTSLYTTLNAIVKLLLIKQKILDISDWKCVSDLASLAGGNVLRIMETADENVGTLNPMDEPVMRHQRKLTKSLKDETLYVGYVRSRELYQANLLLLSSALHDDRLDIQVRHNTIGVRDFRIDAEKLRQRLEEMGSVEGEETEEHEEQIATQPPPVKRRCAQRDAFR